MVIFNNFTTNKVISALGHRIYRFVTNEITKNKRGVVYNPIGRLLKKGKYVLSILFRANQVSDSQGTVLVYEVLIA